MRRLAIPCLLLLLPVLSGCESPEPEGLPPASGLERRGAQALSEGRVQEARELFMQASTQRRSPFLAYIGLARCGIASRDWSLFELAIEAALRANPKSAQAHDLLGRTMILAAKGRGSDAGQVNAVMATRFFAEAKRLDPDLPGLTHHVGVAQLLAGHPDRAVVLLESALRDDPDNDEILASVVVALKRLGRKATLKKLLEALDEKGMLPEERRADLVWASQGRGRTTSRPALPEPAAPAAGGN